MSAEGPDDKKKRESPLEVVVDIRTPKDMFYLECAREIATIMTARYPCGQCGECCQDMDNIVIQDDDIEAIADKIGETRQVFVEKYLRRMGGLWYFREDDICAFLETSNLSCLIHSARPAICGAYPYETPWFVHVIYKIIKFESEGGSPPVLELFMGENCPCRIGLESRVTETISEFLSNRERLEIILKRSQPAQKAA